MTRFLYVAVLMVLLTSLMSSEFNMIYEDNYSAQIEFNIPEYSLKNVEPDMHRLIFTDKDYLESFQQIGLPDVPVLSKLLITPEISGAEISLNITEEEIIENVNLVPSRDLTNLQNGDESYIKDSFSYRKDAFFPEEICQISDIGIMREYHVARVTVNPFRYNPATRQLRIVRKMEITLNYDIDYKATTIIPRKTSREFSKMVDELTINSTSRYDRSDVSEGSILFVYTSPSILSILETLIEWKMKTGYYVHKVCTENTGNTTVQIREYIQELYNNDENPPDYVCLVGDTEDSFGIPTYYEYYSSTSVHGDHPYTLLAGDDIFPEVMIGRLPINSVTELAVIVNKIISYETNPPIDSDWFDRIVLVGDPSDSGTSTISTMNYIANIYEEYNPESQLNEIFDYPFPSQMTNGVNQGASAFYYRGFYGVSGWSNSDINALQNGLKLPFFTLITCHTGQFAYQPRSIIETILLAGTPISPNGGIGAVGSSSATHTTFNNLMTATIAYHLYKEGGSSMAGALNRAKLALYENFPNNPSQYVDWYTIGKNLMGDPSLKLLTKTPSEFVVGFDETITTGSTYTSVQVLDTEGNPVENALVTLYKDDFREMTRTDLEGNANIIFEGITSGEYSLIVTKQNHITSQETIQVEEGNVLSVNPVNLNSNLHPAQTSEFNISVTNFTGVNLNNVQASLTTENPNIEIINGTTAINCNNEESAQSETPFSVRVIPSCQNNETINFTVTINQYENMFTTTVMAPQIEFADLNFVSGEYLMPGEMTSFWVNLNNIGDYELGQSNAVLKSNSSVLILDSLAVFPAVLAEQTTNNSSDCFTIIVSDMIVPGTSIPLSLEITDSNDVFQKIDFDATVGSFEVTDPTGPDLHGYICLDDGDHSHPLCPVFDWIEIDPVHGGNGTILDLVDDDTYGSGDMETID
ncbi:MAG: C25 family cysteine peptidase, partial [Candidatus Cloacimonetes bacterium]|nr:C25 family cysteine peptidase [Candidatus Cloacimonadota bacterium]